MKTITSVNLHLLKLNVTEKSVLINYTFHYVKINLRQRQQNSISK